MLRALQWALLLTLFTCWSISPLAEAPSPAVPEQPAAKQPTLTELGKLYRELALPLPPREAVFACVGPPNSDWGIGPVQPNYELRLVTEGPDRKSALRIWKEFSEVQHEKIEELFPKAPGVDAVLQFMRLNRMKGPQNEFHESRPELIFAIQCHLLNHSELAKFFYWRCLRAEGPSADHRITLDQVLLIAAWNFWADELVNPNRDRAAVSKMLELLDTKHDILNLLANFYSNNDDEDDHKRQTFYDFHKQLLDRLDLTLKPSIAKPGSIEWLIGKLADVSGGPNDDAKWLSDEDQWNRKVQIHKRKAECRGNQSEVEGKLIELGFAAIPALIEHIDDKRLTRIPALANGTMGGNPWRTVVASRFTTVDSLVRQILATYFQFSNDSSNNLAGIKKSDYVRAWEKLKLKTEAEFVSEKLAKPAELDEPILRFIMAKFPERTIAFYQDTLKQNDESPHFLSLVYFIVDSHLPKSAKLDLMTKGARHGRFSFQKGALAGLLELDNPLCTKFCLEALAKLPTKSTKDEEAFHQVDLLRLLLCSEDQAAQQWATKYAKAIPLDLRLALLSDPGPVHYLPKKCDFFRFYRSFSDDIEVYDDDEKAKPRIRGLLEGFRKMEVRNLVAYRVLQALSIRYPLDEKTPPEEWQKVRTFAKNEIDRRLELEERK